MSLTSTRSGRRKQRRTGLPSGHVESITTDRLLLRRVTRSEARALLDGTPLASTPCSGGYPTVDTSDAFGPFLASDADEGPWLVFRRLDGRVIGDMGFDHEIEPGTVSGGYGFAQPAWGHGYATEAVRALVAHSLGCPGIRRIVADTEPTNLASIRVLEKAGFRFERESGGIRYYAIGG